MVLAFGYLGDPVTARTPFEEAKKIITVNFTTAVSLLGECANYLEAENLALLLACPRWLATGDGKAIITTVQPRRG